MGSEIVGARPAVAIPPTAAADPAATSTGRPPSGNTRVAGNMDGKGCGAHPEASSAKYEIYRNCIEGVRSAWAKQRASADGLAKPSSERSGVQLAGGPLRNRSTA